MTVRALFTRRAALTAGAALCAAVPLHAAHAGRVMTVRGAVRPSHLGVVLPHEHVMSIFGADAAEEANYDRGRLFAAVLPILARVRALGARTIADCTAAWFGRDPALLRELSERSGLHLLTNAGYYGAANDRYVPPHAHQETADQLAARWTREWRDGIAGTGIRPGFLKIGVDPGSLSEIDRKLIVAAGRTHRATGLPICVHTGDSPAGAREQLAILRAESVPASAWVWTHANQCRDDAALNEAATQGAWLSFDGLDETSLERHLELILRMRRQGRLGQVLLSHDGNSFRAGGRPPRPYEALFTAFLPKLREAGLSERELRQITQSNPQRALTIRA